MPGSRNAGLPLQTGGSGRAFRRGFAAPQTLGAPCGLAQPATLGISNMADKKLQVIPLGGLGEFIPNSMALRYGDDIIVIDAGMMFPDAELMGVDIVTPDFAYLEQNASM